MKGKRLLSVLLALLLLTARAGYAEDLELPEEASTEAAEPAPEPEEPTESSEVLEEPTEETEEPTEPEETTEETSEEEPEEETGETIEEEPTETEESSAGEELSTEEPEEPELPAGPEEEPAFIEEAPVINVLLPSSGKIVVNPYGLEVPTEYGVSRDQVVHTPQSLTNLSDVPVTVNVRVTGSFAPESGAYLVTAPPAPDTPWKELLLYAEFQPAPYQWTGRFSDQPNQVLAVPWGESKDGVLTLAPWEEGWFRLSGAASAAPEVPWSAEDSVHVSLAFTFEAQSVPEMTYDTLLP